MFDHFRWFHIVFWSFRIIINVKFDENHRKTQFSMILINFDIRNSKNKQKQKNWFGRNFNFPDHVGSEKWFLRGGFFSNRSLKNIFLSIDSEYFSASISGVRICPTCLNQKPPWGSKKGPKNGVFQGDMRSDFFWSNPPRLNYNLYVVPEASKPPREPNGTPSTLTIYNWHNNPLS